MRPDFRIDLERDVGSAPIQVTWSDRSSGYSGGTGTVRAETIDGKLVTSGEVILSAKPLPGRGEKLSLGDVYANAIHAFGGALGLGYCQDCDSMRSMGWKLREGPMRPTDLDLRTLEALLALPNGERAGAPGSMDGVLADLAFVNTGDDRHIYVDIAKPGAAPFVVQLDTGASETVMTPVYARALGVAARAVKSDPHRRESVTGKDVLFWVTDQFFGPSDTRWSYALLGGSYLESYVLEVDVSGRRVRLLDPAVHAVGGEKPRAGEHVVDLELTRSWPLVEVKLGNGTTTALIDTGSMGSVNLTQEAAARLGIALDPKRAASKVAERAGHGGRRGAARAQRGHRRAHGGGRRARHRPARQRRAHRAHVPAERDAARAGAAPPLRGAHRLPAQEARPHADRDRRSTVTGAWQSLRAMSAPICIPSDGEFGDAGAYLRNGRLPSVSGDAVHRGGAFRSRWCSPPGGRQV